MSRLEVTIDAKKEKLTKLKELGVNPFPYRYDKKETIHQCLSAVDSGRAVQTAGRVVSWRAHGKVIFATLADQTGTIQIMFHSANLEKGGAGESKLNRAGESELDRAWQILCLVDPGDFLGVTGLVAPTKTGEITIMVESFEFLGKSLRPLPSSWNAAEDKEIRFRQRYVDLLVNPETKRTLNARWLILKELRHYLENEGFIEVETPILQPLYGGTNAKPFTTHMNALDCDFYLRIAPELYLKRLIVGGMDKIFEVARNFRNEGIDQTHQPEFTMVEWYEAYGDYHRNIELIEGLVKHLNQAVNHRDQLAIGDQTVDLSQPWPQLTVATSLQKFAQIDVEKASDEELQNYLRQYDLKLIGNFSRGKAIFGLFDKLVCHQLIAPTWIIDYPKEVSPLAKTHRANSDLTERYELYIGGKELSDGWSEITDPIDQRARFAVEQQRMRDGDDEAQPTDEEFLEAMEYGLPPLCGVGLGIDRLVMLLTNTPAIKEVIAFPTLRPLNRPLNALPALTELDNYPDKPNSGDIEVVTGE